VTYLDGVFVSNSARDGAFHECGHALISTVCFGRGTVERVDLHECVLRRRPPDGKRTTLVCAAAGVAGERAGRVEGCNVSTIDIACFREAAIACPASEALSFEQAVVFGTKIIAAHRDAYDAMVRWLLKEGSLDGAMVDYLYLTHQRAPVSLH
jgi:hypothetical protein